MVITTSKPEIASVQPLLLFGLLLGGQRAGVAAVAGSLDPELQPLGAERPHLLGDLGPDVEAGRAGAEPLGGGQRLQPGNADAEHQGRRRFHRSRRRGQHREEAGRAFRGAQHRLVSRDIGLGGQRIHGLRPGDARHGLHGETGDAREAQPVGDLGSSAWRQEADHDGSRLQQPDFVVGRWVHLHHDVGRPWVTDGGAGLFVVLVGDQRPGAGAGLDDDGETCAA